MDAVLGKLWEFVNSPVGITLVASLVLYVLNKVYAAKPAWKAYEGTLIAAVRYAEKAIPDSIENAGAKRLDEALKFVCKVYEARTGATPSTAVVSSIIEGLSIVHNNVEPSLTGTSTDNGPELL